MKILPAICCLLVGLVASPISVQAQELLLKDGRTVPAKKAVQESGQVKVTDENGQVSGYPLAEVERIEMVRPPALDDSRALLDAGKTAEAGVAIQALYSQLSGLRGIPGSPWPEATLLYAASLVSEGKQKEADTVLSQLAASVPRDSSDFQVAALRLTGIRAEKNPEDAVRIADAALAKKLGTSINAEANVVKGDGYFFRKKYEEAVTAYLKVVIFSPGDRWLGARSMLGAAKCLAALGEKKDAVRTLNEILVSYSGTSAAVEAKKLLDEGGPAFVKLLDEVKKEEAEAQRKLRDQSTK